MPGHRARPCMSPSMYDVSDFVWLYWRTMSASFTCQQKTPHMNYRSPTLSLSQWDQYLKLTTFNLRRELINGWNYDRIYYVCSWCLVHALACSCTRQRLCIIKPSPLLPPPQTWPRGGVQLRCGRCPRAYIRLRSRIHLQLLCVYVNSPAFIFVSIFCSLTKSEFIWFITHALWLPS